MTNRVLRRGHIAVVTRERPDGKSNSFPLYVASARTDTESRFTLTARVTLTAQNIPEHKPAEQFGLNVGRQGLFMNYREWLLYRAAKYQPEATEPEVLRYTTWRNYQAVQDWMRRSDDAHMMSFMRNEPLTGSSLS